MTAPRPAPADVPDRTEIEVLRSTAKVGVVFATLLTLALGAFAFYGVFSGQTKGGSTVIAVLIGLMFGGLGVMALISIPTMMRHHTLVFDRAGVRYQVVRGGRAKPFDVTWPELAGAAVSTAERNSRTGSTTLVRLDLTPLDSESFATRHPEMAGLAHGAGYRLPLGPNRYLVDELALALRSYAGPRDRGVCDDGDARGLTYT